MSAGSSSPPAADYAVPPSAAPVGEILRSMRMQAGWDLYTVAEHLRIKASYLDAIEGGRYHELPGAAYASGFVRSYSDYLGLDTAEVLRRVKIEMDGQFADRSRMTFPTAEQEGKIPSVPLLLAGVLIAGLVYGGWVIRNHSDQIFDAVPPLPDRLAALIRQSDPAVIPVSSDVAVPPAAGRDEPPPPLPPINPVTGAPMIDAPPPPSEAADPAPAAGGGTVPPQPVPAAQPAAVRPVASASDAAAAGPSALTGTDAGTAVVTETNDLIRGAGQVLLRASQDSWIKVRDGQGRVVKAGLLHKGQTMELPTGTGYRLSVGNAGALTLEIDGRSTGVLGELGRMRLDIPLSGGEGQ